MMFFVSNTSGYFNSFGETFYLEPVQFPNVNITNILAVENTLGEKFKNASSHILQATFDENKIPNFPCPMPEPNQVPDHSRIIILRGGGIGDLIMLISALRILKKILPMNVKLYLATLKEKTVLFKGIKEIEKIMIMPTRMSNMLGMDYYLEFSNHYSLFKKEHMTDFYLALMGIPYKSLPNSGKEPWLSLENAKSQKITSWFQKKRMPVTRHPRTDPYVRYYLIWLLPRVITLKSLTWKKVELFYVHREN